LNNLLLVIDRNNIQIDGFTQDIMPLEPLDKKLEAFGFFVLEVDGHSFEDIASAYEKTKTIHDRTSVIILRTIPGKGVDFMENDYNWHGRAPGIGETVQALLEIRKVRTLDGRVSND
jgi:transketolase